MELGKKTWVFADGDLPPQGESAVSYTHLDVYKRQSHGNMSF